MMINPTQVMFELINSEFPGDKNVLGKMNYRKIQTGLAMETTVTYKSTGAEMKCNVKSQEDLFACLVKLLVQLRIPAQQTALAQVTTCRTLSIL